MNLISKMLETAVTLLLYGCYVIAMRLLWDCYGIAMAPLYSCYVVAIWLLCSCVAIAVWLQSNCNLDNLDHLDQILAILNAETVVFHYSVVEIAELQIFNSFQSSKLLKKSG